MKSYEDLKKHEVLDALIKKEREIIGKRIIAPVISGGKIRAKVGKLILECPVPDKYSGWGVFEITGLNSANLMREAEIWEKEAYTNKMPVFSLGLFSQLSEDSWLAYSFKKNSFFTVLLVEGLRAFDEISAVFDGVNFWFINSYKTDNMNKSEMLRKSLDDGVEPDNLRIPNLKESDVILYKLSYEFKINNLAEEKSNEARNIEKKLRLGGANLIESVKNPSGYTVRWQKNGNEYNSLVDNNFAVISAGFCLSGQDSKQDLTSLASLIGKHE